MSLRNFAAVVVSLMLTGTAVSCRASSAQEMSASPAVVILYSKHCKAYCEKVRPLLQELKQQYPNVSFVEFDTSADKLQDSKEKAKRMGRCVLAFLSDYADLVPYVGFFNGKGKLVKDLSGPKTKECYAGAIEKYLQEGNGSPCPNAAKKKQEV